MSAANAPDAHPSPTATKQRGEVFAPSCPSRQILKHVTSQWGVLILCALATGTHRFNELRRKIQGVSEKMLTQSLRTLEHDGFIERRAYAVIPPHVEYRLTPLGRQVAQHVDALATWIEDNLSAILSARPTSSNAKSTEI